MSTEPCLEISVVLMTLLCEHKGLIWSVFVGVQVEIWGGLACVHGKAEWTYWGGLTCCGVLVYVQGMLSEWTYWRILACVHRVFEWKSQLCS